MQFWQTASIGLCSLAILGASACATLPTPPDWDLFGEMPRDDAFAPGVLVWQGIRMLDADRQRKASPDASPLAQEFASFSRDLRREIVERTVRWVQLNSGLYFEADGEIDTWPTLADVLESGGDDCDGMDVLTFEILRDAGFERGEIYRAVLVREEDQLHHMVTLWFPVDRPQDPFVLDPTGDVTPIVRRLSQVQNKWTPLVLFDETDRFRVQMPQS
ncbi:MAG: hypothetical protein GY725_16030 [bacterium]|nr:hypothetical protein [bacterium]